MQRCVNVIGVGLSPFSPTKLGPNQPARVGSTIGLALSDGGLSASDIAAVYAVSDSLDDATLQRALQGAGLEQAPLCHAGVEDSDASTMFARACTAIAAGEVQSILLLGVQGSPAPALDFQPLGATAGAYMERYRTRPETFAMIAVKARQHAALNPLATFNRALSLEQVLHAQLIADPLTDPQCATSSSGIAALVLCSTEFALRYGNGARVRIAAQACISPRQVAGADQGTSFACLDYAVSVAAARELYEQAGRGPQEVAVCELHDISTVNELLLYEALGFCAEGNGEKMVEDGDNTFGGNLVVNPSGGLLALGHAPAASALAQTIELVLQLRGGAGRRQVVDAQLALQHQAGADGTVTATLLQRD